MEFYGETHLGLAWWERSRSQMIYEIVNLVYAMSSIAINRIKSYSSYHHSQRIGRGAPRSARESIKSMVTAVFATLIFD